MTKKYQLEGFVTLPIQMIVECDSKKIAPSAVAENVLLEADNIFSESELMLIKGFIFLEIDGNITESGAIEFHQIDEITEN